MSLDLWNRILLRSTHLQLLKGRLEEISETPYFYSSLGEFVKKLQEVTSKLLDSYPPAIPEDAVNLLIASVSSATTFLHGSTSKRIPYEIAHCLRLASSVWTSRPTLITTALAPDLYRGFYFLGVQPNFYVFAETFLGVEFESELVQISLPEVYRRRPLYCTPLYHELGHFVDSHRGITNLSLMTYDLDWPLPGVSVSSLSADQKNFIQRSHRMEYFADLFSASYTGRGSREFLAAFAGNQPCSMTHPAVKDRLEVIDSFLSGHSNPLVDMFQATVGALALPPLSISYISPSIEHAFDNVRPYKIQNEKELHGIFDAGWMFLKAAWESPSDQWRGLERSRREQAVNDIVEKSIRNQMIASKWELYAVA